jgi:hypothetical protein
MQFSFLYVTQSRTTFAQKTAMNVALLAIPTFEGSEYESERQLNIESSKTLVCSASNLSSQNLSPVHRVSHSRHLVVLV